MIKHGYLSVALVLAFAAVVPARGAEAGRAAGPAALYSPAELDRVVAPVALYPDALLAHVLVAATYPSDIAGAARWADRHYAEAGARLRDAIVSDHVRWNLSVQALLSFPAVLDGLARDTVWTGELGSAVLDQLPDVLAAIQRVRLEAWNRGYLRSNDAVLVTTGPYVQIVPRNSMYVPVPSYDPSVVLAPPRPGTNVGNAIDFDFGVWLGAPFARWGWETTWVEWPHQLVMLNGVPWQRHERNRGLDAARHVTD